MKLQKPPSQVVFFPARWFLHLAFHLHLHPCTGDHQHHTNLSVFYHSNAKPPSTAWKISSSPRVPHKFFLGVFGVTIYEFTPQFGTENVRSLRGQSQEPHSKPWAAQETLAGAASFRLRTKFDHRSLMAVLGKQHNHFNSQPGEIAKVWINWNAIFKHGKCCEGFLEFKITSGVGSFTS